jgi:hypothetical protein
LRAFCQLRRRQPGLSRPIGLRTQSVCNGRVGKGRGLQLADQPLQSSNIGILAHSGAQSSVVFTSRTPPISAAWLGSTLAARLLGPAAWDAHPSDASPALAVVAGRVARSGDALALRIVPLCALLVAGRFARRAVGVLELRGLVRGGSKARRVARSLQAYGGVQVLCAYGRKALITLEACQWFCLRERGLIVLVTGRQLQGGGVDADCTRWGGSFVALGTEQLLWGCGGWRWCYVVAKIDR